METKYEYRLVAFIDILGFSDLVEKSKENEEYLVMILDALEEFKSELEKERPENSFEVAQFSDSLVISVPYVDTAVFFTFIMKLNLIQKILAEKNILIRGGVSAGKLYHRGTIAFGPSFIEAYKIESQLAEYPRIVIDPKIINLISLPESVDKENMKFEMGFWTFQNNTYPIVLKDWDGLFFVNYLYGWGEEAEVAKSLLSYLETELEKLNSNKLTDNKVIRKIKWNIAYINEGNQKRTVNKSE